MEAIALAFVIGVLAIILVAVAGFFATTGVRLRYRVDKERVFLEAKAQAIEIEARQLDIDERRFSAYRELTR